MDAWTLGPSKSFTKSETLQGHKAPAEDVDSTFTKALNGPTPIPVSLLYQELYTYQNPSTGTGLLFPVDYLEKCEKHIEMFGLQELRGDMEILKNHLDDPASFLEESSRDTQKRIGLPLPRCFGHG